MTESHLTRDSDIAIIGLSCRFSGANDSDAFWQNLRGGIESVTFFSDEELIATGIESTTLKQPNYVKAGAILANVELFDAEFFDFSPREAEITDPQHRIFLECAWESLENAGYALQPNDSVIGVYAGVGTSSYLLNNLYPYRDTLADIYSLMIGNDKDYLPTRVSYKLNLRGPSINVQTACSTSLVAIHLACQSLLNGECDMALAGGISIFLPQKSGYWYQEGMIHSPDGHCRAFDVKAQGTVDSDGVGIVVLKRLAEALADGDHIHAVIKGSAINNDGTLKVGYTAPSVEGQAAVISEAQAMAGIEAETISYIEAHGTGTKLGDPIEIAALTKAFRVNTNKKGFCAIGSVKTNIGHTGVTAGVAGLIKTVLALKHQLLPPSLHFEQPNPHIDFANSPFYVNKTLSKWNSNGTLRRAGVSSFGIGGTNAHVILEEAPVVEVSGSLRSWQLLVLSAKTPTALNTTTANLANYLTQHPDINLADVAYTLSKGRQSFQQRRILVSQSTLAAATALQMLDPQKVFTASQPRVNRPIIFMFSGQGAQYVNMAYELYQTEPNFRKEIDNCANYLKPQLGLDLRQILYPSSKQLAAATQQINQTALTQAALFVVEYALAKLWISYGIYPQAMIGHSIGEYVAACLANVLSLEDALSLVAIRGQMMQSLPTGSMLAVLLSESELQPFLHQGLALAAINGPQRCVISGHTAAVEALQNQLTQQGVECRRLLTSHAFHSEMMTPILATFTKQVQQITLKAPQIPYISNVTGTWITSVEATNPNYWATHLRQTVRFAAGLQTLLADSRRILLEVGPGRTLSTLAKQYSDKVAKHSVLSSLRHPHDNQSDIAFLLNTLGQLWLMGVSVDWSGFYANERRQRLPLPTYPFERQRYWIDLPKPTDKNIQPLTIPQENPGVKFKATINTPLISQAHFRSEQLSHVYITPRNKVEKQIAKVWQEVFSIASLGIHDNFFELGGDSLIAVSLAIKLRDLLQISLPPQSVLQSPTIAQLAELIVSHHSDFNASKQPLQTVSPLVAIRSTGSKVPFFCIHPVGGNIFCYTELAHYLDLEQPVYGLQAKGLDGQEEPLTQVEDMAKEYLNALQRIQPHGPYLLGGWSFGGVVAFEMAQQLRKQDQQVALLALFDIGPPLKISQLVTEATLLTWFAIDLGICVDSEASLWLDTLENLESQEQLFYFLTQGKQAKILPATTEIRDIQPLVQVFKANLQALQNYIPQPYPNSITLFRATESFNFLTSVLLESSYSLLEWGKLSQEPLEIYTVSGSNHYTILAKPYIEQVGKQLTHCIKKVQSKTI
ncbi:MAG: acyltransferase domain-containing protein [Thioploca sp.]|nr:acyltransferase domain-containing protein [Thioploca sp.]